MAEAFYGRVAAYEEGLAADDSVLQAALARNLYGTAPPAEEHLAEMATYLRRETAHLDRQPTAALLAGDVVYGEPPGPAHDRE
jgi:cytochrome b pre-mRNA-processing protein 3